MEIKARENPVRKSGSTKDRKGRHSLATDKDQIYPYQWKKCFQWQRFHVKERYLSTHYSSEEAKFKDIIDRLVHASMLLIYWIASVMPGCELIRIISEALGGSSAGVQRWNMGRFQLWPFERKSIYYSVSRNEEESKERNRVSPCFLGTTSRGIFSISWSVISYRHDMKM